jgi:hypothetical protein
MDPLSDMDFLLICSLSYKKYPYWHIWLMYFAYMYKNRTMKALVLRREEEDEGE